MGALPGGCELQGLGKRLCCAAPIVGAVHTPFSPFVQLFAPGPVQHIIWFSPILVLHPVSGGSQKSFLVLVLLSLHMSFSPQCVRELAKLKKFSFSFFLSFRLILGMMLTTSFLSMWLSNTASTAMMLPIANAILKSLFGEKDTSKDMNRENEESQGN